MRMNLISALSTAVLCAGLTAQDPAMMKAPNFNPDLSNTFLSAATGGSHNITGIGQYQLRVDPTLPGNYYLMLTCQYSGPGAAGGWDCLAFWYDTNTTPPTVTVTGDMDPINTPDDEFQCSVSADLKSCVLDLGVPGNAVPSVCSRASAGSAGAPVAFGSVTAMSGVPVTYIDPTLSQIGGQDVLYYIDGPGNIQVTDINLATGATSNNRMASAIDPSIVNVQFNHSPGPVEDVNNEAKGLHHSVFESGAGSHVYFNGSGAPGLGGNAKFALKLVDSANPTGGNPNGGTDWIANPSVVGGTHNWADSQAGVGYGEALNFEVLGCTDEYWQNGQAGATLTAFAPVATYIAPGVPQYIGVIAAGPAIPGGIPLPYNGNNLFVDTVAGWISPLGNVDAVRGIMTVSVPLPSGITGSFKSQIAVIDLNQIAGGATAAVWLGGVGDINIQ